ncbi:hypothetical protein QQ045_024596 [Rhodiola kirilowii]
MSSSSAPAKVVAEYAKSGRSSCKNCTKGIEAKALRLGLVSKDVRRGFDVTKWYHLDCFKEGLEMTTSVEKINGFDSLKMSDQESLKALVEMSAKQVNEQNQDEADTIENPKKRKGSYENEKADTVDLPKMKEKIDPDAMEETKIVSAFEEMSAPIRSAEVVIKLSISDIKDVYKDAILRPKWKAYQTIIFLEKDDGLQDSSKIAAFDFDGCLANTSVKRTGPDAWSLMYPSIPDKLQSLYNDGYKLVIFTNESNIDRWIKKRQVAVDSKIGRLTNFINRVKVPMQVFIACGLSKPRDGVADAYRKPKPGMWHIMEQHFNSGIAVDMDQSFYVGDTAGREGDHSDADIKFAQAIGLKFYVPEEYFNP